MRWWHWLLLIGGGALLLGSSNGEVARLRHLVATRLEPSVAAWELLIAHDGVTAGDPKTGKQHYWKNVDTALTALQAKAATRTAPAAVSVEDIRKG